LKKSLELLLDFLMFVVPILELTDVMTFIPVDWLPYYMITTVVLRRLLRLLEDKLRAPTQTPVE
jgi:uncharacterized membrane protein